MARRGAMGPWTRGPLHGGGTSHKVRRSHDGEVIEESYTEPSFYLWVFGTLGVCSVGWWWQLVLDGWARAAVLTLTILVTVYVVANVVAYLLTLLFGSFIRRL